MFLDRQELNTVSTDQLINTIVNSDSSIVDSIIAESIDVISTYLYQNYDTEAIFQATADARNLTVLKHLKAIVRHEIYARRSRSMSEVVKQAYDEAMTWLEKVGEGKIKPPLPPRQVDTDGDGEPDSDAPFLRLGSRKNHENRF